MSARVYVAATGTVKGDGTLTITFQNTPPPGLIWTGSVNVFNALGNEHFTANVNSEPWGQFNGASPFAVQLSAQEILSITGSGLTAGLVYSAVLIGSSDPEGSVPLIGPQPQTLTLDQIASAIAIAGNVATKPVNGTLLYTGTAPPANLDCSEYETLLIEVQSNGFAGQFQASFQFQVPSSTAAQEFTSEISGVISTAVYELPVLGPTVDISLAANHSIYVFGISKAIQINNPQTVIYGAAVPYAGSSNFSEYPSVARPGKYKLWVNATTLCAIGVQFWNGVGWPYLIQEAGGDSTYVLGNPGQDAVYEFVAPMSDWRLIIRNTSASAGQAYFGVTGPYV